jgi:hypothetical protein
MPLSDKGMAQKKSSTMHRDHKDELKHNKYLKHIYSWHEKNEH